MANPRGGGGLGLEGLMRGLKLSEEERNGVRGEWKKEVTEAEKMPQAVGKLFSSKSGSMDGLVRTLEKIWCPVQGIRCKELGNNLFLFTFLQPGRKRRAVSEGPWDFDDDLVIVVDFDGNKRLKDLEFLYVPVWIRAFDLPLGMMNSAIGMAIGNRVGKTILVDAEMDGSAVGSFLRVKVQIDIRRPLMRGITLEDDVGAGSIWCPLEYEFLPNFCYGCGRLGHVEKDCDENVVEELGEKKFGVWLCASSPKRRGPADSRSRWSGGGSSGGSKQRSGESWRMKPGQDKDRTLAASWRSSSHNIDPELRDDGTSPVKKLQDTSVVGAVQPRSLTFEHVEGASNSKEKGEQVEEKVEEKVAGELQADHVGEKDSDGNITMQKAVPEIENKRDMDVDDDMRVEMKEKTKVVGLENLVLAQEKEGGGCAASEGK